MDYSGGYSGCIAVVDLTNRSVETIDLIPDLIHRFLGGRGLGAYLLSRDVAPGVDPLSPANEIIFETGPFTGLWLSAGRLHITARSPLTGTIGDGNSGGAWAPELKAAGFDALIVRGRADSPVFLLIKDAEIEIHPADDSWGKCVGETTDLLRSRLNDADLKVLAIGPAGENQVRFACVMNDYARAVGQGGLGAVMGSKNLKAVAVRSHGDIRVARPREVMNFLREKIAHVRKKPGFEYFKRMGTTSLIAPSNEVGYACYKNMQYTRCPDADALSSEHLEERGYFRKSMACYGCFLGCSHLMVSKRGTVSEGIEFGTLNEVTACGITDADVAIEYNRLCNEYSLDTFDTGHVIAFAMECFEKGLLTTADSGGIDLQFGNSEGFLALVHQIACRSGLGDLLAEGLVRAAESIGEGSLEFANHIKGMALDTDIRGMPGWGLGYIISSIGADHLRGSTSFTIAASRAMSPEQSKRLIGRVIDPSSYEDAPWAVWYEEKGDAVQDSLGLCKFISSPHGGPDLIYYKEYSELLHLVSGIEIPEREFDIIGERILNVERAFNAREGFSRKDDTVPPRMREPARGGYNEGTFYSQEMLDVMLDGYYRLHKWDVKTGLPNPERLRELDLPSLAEQIEKISEPS
ncbi:aldehyde ferredoxin oxidoreductase family protein [Candidatus Bipolaricaulota bacterium]